MPDTKTARFEVRKLRKQLNSNGVNLPPIKPQPTQAIPPNRSALVRAVIPLIRRPKAYVNPDRVWVL